MLTHNLDTTLPGEKEQYEICSKHDTARAVVHTNLFPHSTHTKLLVPLLAVYSDCSKRHVRQKFFRDAAQRNSQLERKKAHTLFSQWLTRCRLPKLWGPSFPDKSQKSTIMSCD